MRLDDDTILPHYLTMDVPGGRSSPGTMTNLSFRSGEIKDIIYPDSISSVSKKWTEYSVEVQHKDDYTPGTVATYPNCTVVNLFGGVADKFTFTLRKDPNGQAQSDSSGGDGLGQGSKVLLLCINGETPNAVIVGGIRDGNDTPDSKSDGHHLDWSFNGMTANVNDSGELTVTFNGATNVDGSPRSDVVSGAAGSKTVFKKDGTIEISQGQQSITIDTPNNKVEVTSNGYTARIDGSGTKLGGDSANDAIEMGTTRRTAEQIMHATMTAGLTTMTIQLGALSGALAAAAGFLVIPVVGAMLAAVPIGAAASIVGTMIAAVGVLISAIQAYEAGSVTFLSKSNFTSF